MRSSPASYVRPLFPSFALQTADTVHLLRAVLRQLQSKLETLEQQAVDVLGERERRDEGEEQAEAEETGEQQRERQWDLSDSS